MCVEWGGGVTEAGGRVWNSDQWIDYECWLIMNVDKLYWLTTMFFGEDCSGRTTVCLRSTAWSCRAEFWQPTLFLNWTIIESSVVLKVVLNCRDSSSNESFSNSSESSTGASVYWPIPFLIFITGSVLITAGNSETRRNRLEGHIHIFYCYTCMYKQLLTFALFWKHSEEKRLIKGIQT